MLPALFAATLFAGSAALFLVQPLVGKLLLPIGGGSPNIWNTCMVFFQLVLLAGYLYAHRATGSLGVRRQAAAHLLLLATVAVALYAAVAATGSPIPVLPRLLPEDQDNPVLGLVALLAVAVGVPYFVLSTTSPILQRWFAATGHPSARDPYFLSAAGNAGCLLGLLGYPLVLERHLTLAQQQWVFAGAVAAYLGLVVVCAFVVMRNAECGTRNGKTEEPAADGGPGSALRTPHSALRTPRVARWVFLSAMPSSLLLGVTTHVSTTLNPIPLLWAVPLALYLVSFILVFARWPDRLHQAVGRVTPVLLLFTALSLLLDLSEPFGLVLALHLGAFTGVCLVCHGELAKDRPPPEHLTAFYFWLSVGGVLGGAFNALAAPVVFGRLGMVEYPLALVLAAAVRPRGDVDKEPPLRAADVLLVLGLLAVTVGLVLLVPRYVVAPGVSDADEPWEVKALRGGLMFGLPAAAVAALVRRPARFALSLGALFVAGAFDAGRHGETLHTERNFYGVLRVARSPDGKFVRLLHGKSVDGMQRADEAGPPQPMTYYYKRGPVGHLFENLADRAAPKDLWVRPVPVTRVGVVGLGIGSVAHYAEPGQHWTFFELDPAVVRAAQNPAWFRFLSTCKAEYEVVLGDARRQLARRPDAGFDLIILDGFCSGSRPVHLLTREALEVYVRKLAPNGVLAVNVTNRHLDLPPLVARAAAAFDPPLSVRYRHDQPTDALRAEGKDESEWMILARDDAALGPVAWDPYWDPVRVTAGPVWRDDFADTLGAWRKDGH
ncbi:MAG: hypothetical protein C0501_06575 [Isosphaera sp.]|nr:hypothetical protein [Isosphaera sp.]